VTVKDSGKKKKKSSQHLYSVSSEKAGGGVSGENNELSTRAEYAASPGGLQAPKGRQLGGQKNLEKVKWTELEKRDYTGLSCRDRTFQYKRCLSTIDRG